MPRSTQGNQSIAPHFTIYENAGTLRISVQDPAKAGQVVKNIHAAKEAIENVVGVTA